MGALDNLSWKLRSFISPLGRTFISMARYPHVRLGWAVHVTDSVIGNNVFIGSWSYVRSSTISNNVSIGNRNMVIHSTLGRHTYTGNNVHIGRSNIGSFTSISWNVTVGASEHDYTYISQHKMLFDSNSSFVDKPIYSCNEGDVNIGNDVWIGTNAVILRDVNIGNGAVIGAGAVVTHDVPEYAIAVGVPARIVKYRFDQKTIQALNEIRWWDFPDDVIKQNISLIASRPSAEVLKKLLDLRSTL